MTPRQPIRGVRHARRAKRHRPCFDRPHRSDSGSGVRPDRRGSFRRVSACAGAMARKSLTPLHRASSSIRLVELLESGDQVRTRTSPYRWVRSSRDNSLYLTIGKSIIFPAEPLRGAEQTNVLTTCMTDPTASTLLSAYPSGNSTKRAGGPEGENVTESSPGTGVPNFAAALTARQWGEGKAASVSNDDEPGAGFAAARIVVPPSQGALPNWS